MGSSGMKKSRKGGNRQHLDKAGTHSHAGAAHEQQLERQAVLDTMGIGATSGVGRVMVWIVLGLFAIAALAGLLVLTLF